MADEAEDWGVLIALGLAAFGIYWLWTSFGKSAAAGVEAGTSAVASGIADIYEGLTFGPAIQAAGTLASQSGAVLGPISSFPAATDSSGNTYLNVNGTVYQLGPRNAQGNFTAIPTGATASAGTATIPSAPLTASNTAAAGAPAGMTSTGPTGTGNTYG